LCQFYKTKKDLIEILVPYFSAGLAQNEYCMWITSEPLSVEEATRALSKAVPDVRKYWARKQIEIIPHDRWYLKDGSFNAQRVLKSWVARHNRALRRGFDGLRLTGNTFWLEKRHWNRFTAYEETINRVVGDYKIIALCTYSLERCGALEIMDVMRNHQFALVNRDGTWETVARSELRKQEAVLRETEARYKIIADHTYDFEFWIDPDGRYLYASPSSQRITGCGPEEYLSDPSLRRRLVHPDDRAVFDEHCREVEKRRRMGETEYRIVRPDGSVRWISHACRPVLGRGGRFMGIRGSNRDITAMKTAEQSLTETKDYLEKLLDYANAPIICWDSRFRITRFNHAFEELVGRGAREVIGKNLSILFPKDSRAESLVKIRRTLGGEHWEVVEIPVLTADGTVRVVLWNSANIYADDGKTVVATIAQGQDITERKQAEDTILSLSRFPEENPNPVMRVLRDGTLQYANAAALAMEGWRLQVGKQAPAPLLAPARQAVRQRRQLNQEMEMAGRVWWMTVAPFASESYVNVYCRDITESKDAERALRESETRFRGLAEAMPQLVWSADAAGAIDYCNSRTFEYAGQGLADAGGWKWSSMINPEDLKDTREAWRQAMRVGDVFVIEHRLRRQDGEYRWHLTRGVPARDAAGRPIRWIGTATDIHDYKLAEQTLRRTRDYLEKLLDYANAPIICWDPKYRITLFNHAFENLANLKAEQVIGKDLSILFPDESTQESLSKIRRASRGEFWESVEVPILSRGSGVRTVLWNSANIYSEEGEKVVATIAQGHDITERKAAEEELRRAHQFLEKKVLERTAELTTINVELSRQIEERTRVERDLERTHRELMDAKRLSDIGTLAATVAHELRNPLAAIRMATYNVRRKAQGVPVAGHLETIDKKIDESDQIINNLLFYSRLRVPNYEQVDVHALLEDNIKTIRSRVGRKAASVRKNLRPLVGVTLELDSLQMREVFSNVLNNAFDALGGDGGEIEIDSSLTDEYMKVSVRDTGEGVEEDFLDRVFEPFFTTKAKGTGLGLTVCKQIVELHGGQIHLDSTKGEGTVVTITLPRARSQHGKENSDRGR